MASWFISSTCKKRAQPILYFDWLYILRLIISFHRFIWVGYKDAFFIKISKRFLNIRGLRLSSEMMDNDSNMKFLLLNKKRDLKEKLVKWGIGNGKRAWGRENEEYMGTKPILSHILCFVQSCHSPFALDSFSFRVPPSSFPIFVRRFAYYCGKLTQYTTVLPGKAAIRQVLW